MYHLLSFSDPLARPRSKAPTNRRRDIVLYATVRNERQLLEIEIGTINVNKIVLVQ